MTAPNPARPVLGVALTLANLRVHRDWILERQRDLEIQDFIWADLLNGDWRPLAAEIKAELAGHTGRVGIHGPFWGLNIATPDPEIRAVVTKRMQQGLDVCAELGASHMVIHSPYTTWDYNNLDNNPGSRVQIIERCHDALRTVVARAEELGVTLVIENIEDKDPMARVELARSFESKAVRVSLDTGHANYAHGSTGAPPVDYFVRVAGDMLHHVHLQDTDGHADRHWNPGEGNIAWHAVFRALADLTSNPRLILEVRHPLTVRSGAEHLARLGLAE
ncbi:MAG: sugar phosphate isomerase/epimerase [Hyphomicrobiaceae bacterium]|nr:sugar phosphate isomerase/epimerase [Hyphomicrobiaceae bacterium]